MSRVLPLRGVYKEMAKLIKEYTAEYKGQEIFDLLRVIEIMHYSQYSCDDILIEVRLRFVIVRDKIISKLKELHAAKAADIEKVEIIEINAIHHAKDVFPNYIDVNKKIRIKTIIVELETMEEKYGIQKNK